MPTLDLHNALNDAQREAVCHHDGPLLILAGAGTGKTRVITWRIAWLLQEGYATPDQILGVTFTNKAAREMAERVGHLVGPSAAYCTLRTFHSACARWLRRYAHAAGLTPSFSIFDDDDQLALVRQVADDLNLPSDAAATRSYRDRIEQARHAALRPTEVLEQARGREGEQFATLFVGYQKALQRQNACDFGDLVCRMVWLLEEDDRLRTQFRARYTHVMVDEFQDTNVAQYRLVQALAGPTAPIAVVGDDDQSIYRWRGATVENVRQFRDDYRAHTVALEENYRSTRVILDVAHAVVSRLPSRLDKRLRTNRQSDDTVSVHVAVDDREEAEFIARTIERLRRERGLRYADMAIFYRTNAQSRVLEERLRAGGVPHEIVGATGFYDRREIRDVLGWLRAVQNPADDIALRRVVQAPTRGVGKATLDQLDLLRRDGAASSLWDAVHRHNTLLKRLTSRAKEGLGSLVRMLETMRHLAEQVGPAGLIDMVLEDAGYAAWVNDTDGDTAEERLANLRDLRESARLYREENPEGDVVGFLESCALRQADTNPELPADATRVTLMTVHAAKGLEFPVVFVTGLEDGQFPHERKPVGLRPEDAEEERRLFYVAVTRAQDLLFLSASMRRRLFGQTKPCAPSPFLLELEDAAWRMAPESASATLDWRRTRSGGNDAPRRAAYDEFDQRTWQERAAVALEPSVPEDGVVFDDSYYPTESVRAAQAYVGRLARHKLFGVGRVVEADPAGERVRLTIDFPEVGKKKVVMSFVELLPDGVGR